MALNNQDNIQLIEDLKNRVSWIKEAHSLNEQFQNDFPQDHLIHFTKLFIVKMDQEDTFKMCVTNAENFWRAIDKLAAMGDKWWIVVTDKLPNYDIEKYLHQGHKNITPWYLDAENEIFYQDLILKLSDGINLLEMFFNKNNNN